MTTTNKTVHPLFIISVFILILNDWYLKPVFHNTVTGKLSDFAGLFALPYLLSSMLPKHTLKIHVWTGLLFIVWKSEFAEPLIAFANSFGLPISRTVDFTDNIALISLLISYFTLKNGFSLKLKPVLHKALLVISCMAFVATSMPPRENRKFTQIDKVYTFDFSKRELVSRLNMVQVEEVRKINKGSGKVDFNEDCNIFYFQGSTDTLALLLDYRNIHNDDTIRLKTSVADIMITGDDHKSELKLLTVYKTVPLHADKDYRKKTIREFEKRIVKKITNYR